MPDVPDFQFRCRHCPRPAPPLLTVAHLGEHEEGLLRAHLQAAHPELPTPKWLGDVLEHFEAEQAT